ncbi:pentatricopeptide repeat-containing protein At4g20740 [Impatiens glandulifera]|uniref:pentatricopeptide repeat-containing protein At4g20740 n=1 Tax=Impatiens glandulifera TaxID=253017 RepID=UPI001FB08DD5|nr:pentatricopeptide repeat-containing protein At4g20740 [Impatiens glandulifera]
MPPPSQPAQVKNKLHFFYGHRKPTQNRPTVRGGLFSNRETLNPKPLSRLNPPINYDIQRWDPDSPNALSFQPTKTPSEKFFNLAQNLSPIARFIVDSFRKHKSWGKPVMDDLNKLRRVTPKLVAEVVKFQTDARMAAKFFYWAGKQKGYRHDFACYNAFTYCLNRNNEFRSADQVPELMQMQGKPPTEKQFEILIRMHSDANRGLRVHYVYEKMKKFGLKPRVFLYNKIIDCLVKTDHLDLAMSVYDDFKKDGLVEESVTYMILVKGLCKAGKVDDVLDLLEKMRTNLCKPDIFAYTAIFRVMIKEKNLEGSLRVWEEMKKDKIVPDVRAYATLIIGLCRGEMVEKAYMLFEEMKEKGCLIDRSIYGSLVDGFVAKGKISLALDLLKDLMNLGYRADLNIYNSLISGLCNAGRVDKAHKLFRFTVQESLQPDFLTVNPILISFALSDRMSDFFTLLQQMNDLGRPVIDDLSGFFTSLVGDLTRVEKALEVFEHSKSKGYCSTSIYNVLIEALHKMGETERALSLFRELTDSEKHKPDLSSYNIAIICYSDIGDIQEASICYNEMMKMSLFPSVDAYISLVTRLCVTGEIDAGMMLIRDCLANVTNGPLEFKYSLTILYACKSSKRIEDVVEVVNEMIEEGGTPDEIIWCAIISGMCKYGTVEEARKVLSYMRDRKLMTESDLVVYDEKLIDHMKRKTADLVLSGLKFFGLEGKLESKGLKLSD